ncbi:MAG: cation transporter [Alteromonadaceae bacterium]|nr:MAG: cation transporter [Alteromonadaceae bacterium]
MRHTISLSCTLAAIWLLNSGHYNPLILFFGVISVAFCVALALRLKIVDGEAQPLSIYLRLPLYWLWLMREIITSNITVVKHIWLSPKDISPVVATLPLDQRSDLARVIYANSITITPGTVTLDVDENTITVHALTHAGLASLKTGDMSRRVSALEK